MKDTKTNNDVFFNWVYMPALFLSNLVPFFLIFLTKDSAITLQSKLFWGLLACYVFCFVIPFKLGRIWDNRIKENHTTPAFKLVNSPYPPNINMEEEIEALKQDMVSKSTTNNNQITATLELEEPTKTTTISTVWNRDIDAVAYVKQQNNYKCEIDPNHQTFTNKNSNESYVEAHHLIPLKHQEHFRFNLNDPNNLVTLCPNCHKLLHYADIESKRDYLAKLLSTRKLPIYLEQLLELYK